MKMIREVTNKEENIVVMLVQMKTLEIIQILKVKVNLLCQRLCINHNHSNNLKLLQPLRRKKEANPNHNINRIHTNNNMDKDLSM